MINTEIILARGVSTSFLHRRVGYLESYTTGVLVREMAGEDHSDSATVGAELYDGMNSVHISQKE